MFSGFENLKKIEESMFSGFENLKKIEGGSKLWTEPLYTFSFWVPVG